MLQMNVKNLPKLQHPFVHYKSLFNFFRPDGRRVRSKPELIKFLEENGSTLTADEILNSSQGNNNNDFMCVACCETEKSSIALGFTIYLMDLSTGLGIN